MEVEMMVGLLIPDTTALTALHTLEGMGYGKLRKIEREDYYKISANAQDFREVSNELSKVDILVNANKNTCRMKLAGQPFSYEGDDGVEDGIVRVKILVKEDDGDGGRLLDTLKNRLGLSHIESINKGVLWTLHLETDADSEVEDIAKEIAEKLLSNMHYQEYMIFR